MVETTNLVLANKSESLRTTVPAHIARQFKLKAGDRLAWEMVVEDGGLKIVVSPVRNEQGSGQK